MRSLNLCVAVIGILSVVGNSRAATTYTYDDLGRLTRATYDNGKQIDYTYDPAGNRTQVATTTTPPHGAMLATKAAHRERNRKKL